MTRAAGPADFKKPNIVGGAEQHVETIDPCHGRVQHGSAALLRRTNSLRLIITLLHHSQMVDTASHCAGTCFEAMK
ncbi:MAG TPA: hypothetical protein PLV07_07880 [Acidiphilium sp.]|uniref:hypothetical protein n=1 Tax=unclassified Acidiphilium TaxID=2617493 RepID=UPI000BC7EFB5|nr:MULTISPECIES: hypothetical protein [unclassified Acidiphilium]OYV67644.1 MAG: hypothetical protein B7X09_00795 [Acidiphilium sp. 21-66-27]HQT62481.1 hypothetical protein [Acidiphilium sp.]HQU11488.1 hypothetical protein [Acidiphilium sp.]